MFYPQFKNIKTFEDLRHDCKDFIELRERNKGNGTAYGYQCQFCGEFRGGEVRKKNVSEKPDWYDPDLEDTYYEILKKISESVTPQLKTNSEFIPAEIIDHSSELEEIINKYCDNNNVEKTYIVQKFLTGQRLGYINEKFESIWKNEKQLHKWLKENLSEHFEIHNEVDGYGFINREKRKVRIDFVLRAKKKLIEKGFTEQYIGVEVKYFSPKDGKNFRGKSSSGVFQALSYWYSGARWLIPNQGETDLATVLMFSNLSFQDESDALFNTLDSHYKKIWKAYLSIANHANVGELLVRTNNGSLSYWAMEYSGANYFSMLSNGEYIKGNPNVINKKRIGNSR